jgi:hypothetical protein
MGLPVRTISCFAPNKGKSPLSPLRKGGDVRAALSALSALSAIGTAGMRLADMLRGSC